MPDPWGFQDLGVQFRTLCELADVNGSELHTLNIRLQKRGKSMRHLLCDRMDHSPFVAIRNTFRVRLFIS